MTTRIIAGSAGGRRLRTPPGTGTRPTTGRVREALFSSLGDLDGLRVLDLYAGSGALGLEALSRELSATFVERSPSVAALVRQNIAELGFQDGSVVTADVEAFLAGPAAGPAQTFDLVLVDPPYETSIDPVLAALSGWVSGTVVVERATRDEPPVWPPDLRFARSRAYGETTLWYGHSP